MLDFYKTRAGKIFFECQLPELIKNIERLAKAVEESNRIEKENNQGKPAPETGGSEE